MRPRNDLEGVPQGTVLGPVLFDFYVHSLSEALSTIPDLKHGFYADDLTLIAQDWNAAATVPTLQKERRSFSFGVCVVVVRRGGLSW